MHLMQDAIRILRSKDVEITAEEENAAIKAILLHDIGHGPFSHALESAIIPEIGHENLSLRIMERMNQELNGSLTLAMDLFVGRHPKRFLHQLISSQLDMDRLDYLRRDSFYTGVSEGSVNTDRLLQMLNVHDDELVVDAKGIHSVEKFLVARTLMYWQVYLHKTVLSAEYLLVNILRRARELALGGHDLPSTPVFRIFLENTITLEDLNQKPELLNTFAQLDDIDVLAAIKMWMHHEDHVLQYLSRSLVMRELLHVEMLQQAPAENRLETLRRRAALELGFSYEETAYVVFVEKVSSYAYNSGRSSIKLLYRDGEVRKVEDAAEELNLKALKTKTERYALCYPKTLEWPVAV
jgi:HD superfamily phosphohydrolase